MNTNNKNKTFSSIKVNRKFKNSNINQKNKEKEINIKNFNSDYIPYSENEIKKSINYYKFTYGFYNCADALEKYLYHLQRYKKGEYQRPPRYPNLYTLYPEPPKKYKRPVMYQGVSSTASSNYFNKRSFNKKINKSENIKSDDEPIFIDNEFEEEEGTIIK